MASFHINDLGNQDLDSEVYSDLETEIQTDKPMVKLVPCRDCQRPLVVTTFFAPAKAQCRSCKGEVAANGVQASVGQPIPGKTEPAKAVDLTKTLVNATFAQALCPVHPADEEHVMELKHVHHNEQYGPSEFMGYQNGKPIYRQTDVGETVLHQCTKCKAVVTYTTTAVTQFGKINKPGQGKNANVWVDLLGVEHDSEEVAV